MTIVPGSRGRMRARAAMVPQTWPRNVTSIARWNSAGSTSPTGANTVVMALLTQTAMGPSCSRRGWRPSTASNCHTSAGRPTARRPGAVTSAAAASRPAWPRASKPTSNPCSAKARAVARPTPADAPVITATRRAVMSCPSCGCLCRYGLPKSGSPCFIAGAGHAGDGQRGGERGVGERRRPPAVGYGAEQHHAGGVGGVGPGAQHQGGMGGAAPGQRGLDQVPGPEHAHHRCGGPWPGPSQPGQDRIAQVGRTQYGPGRPEPPGRRGRAGGRHGCSQGRARRAAASNASACTKA